MFQFKRGESKRPPGVRGTVRRDEPDIATVQAVHNDAFTTRVRGTVRRDEPDIATVQAVHNVAFTTNNLEADTSEFNHQVHRTSMSSKPRC